MFMMIYLFAKLPISQFNIPDFLTNIPFFLTERRNYHQKEKAYPL